MLLLAAFAQGTSAQSRRAFVRGIVCEEDSSSVVIQAAVQLLSPKDSSNIEATMTDISGQFSLGAPLGEYILKVSLLGYKPHLSNILLNGPDLDLGSIILSQDALWLEGAVVSDRADPVKVVGDTVVYNAAALLVEEDATLEELLSKIPGLEIDQSGNVLLNGRPIKQLYIGGRRFFGGDVKAALKNLEANLIENVKAYDRDSDFTRLTGIDDGEKEPVLDLTVKKKMMGAWQNTVGAGIGTSQRYGLRASANRIDKNKQTSIIINRNNTVQPGGISSTGQSVLGSGGSGDRTYTEAGISFSRDIRDGEISGHLQYNGTDRFTDADLRSQTFNATGSTFNHGRNISLSYRQDVKGDLTFEWKPDKSTTVFIKPTFTYNHTNGSTDYSNFSYRYENDSSLLNNVGNLSRNFIHKAGATFTAQYTRRLAKKGRSFTVRNYDTYNYTGEENLYDYNTRYHNIKSNPDSVLIRKNYLQTLYHTIYGYLQFSWNEPLGKGFHLQMSARAEYRYQTNARDFFDIGQMWPGWSFAGEGSYSTAVERLPLTYTESRSELFSASGNYSMFSSLLMANMRYVRKKFNITAGVSLRPETGILRYPTSEGMQRYRTNVFHAAPNINLRYNKSKSEYLSLSYNSWSGSPGLYNLLPVSSGTNPLYIHYGNPELKPTFTHSAKFTYNCSNSSKRSSYVLDLGFNLVENSVSNSTIYDETTGGRTVTPVNINGNWKVTGSFVTNKTFKGKLFSLTNHIKAEYQHGQSYLYNGQLKEDELNSTGRLMARELMEGCFRNKWMETILSLGGDYTLESNRLRPGLNRQPYTIYGGASMMFTLPWKMRLSAKYTELYQHGYYYTENRGESFHLLNASVSQTVLKGHGTLRIDAYDILKNQKNVVRSFSTTSRSTNTYNGINFYVMLRFTYRFKTGTR